MMRKKKITKEEVKEFWEKNKSAICFGLGMAASVGILMVVDKILYTDGWQILDGLNAKENKVIIAFGKIPRKENPDLNKQPRIATFRLSIDETEEFISNLRENMDRLKSSKG